MKRTRPLCLLSLWVGLVPVFLAGCGYRVASKNRLSPQLQTLAVLPLENETTTFQVEQIFTRSLIHAFVERSSYRLVHEPSQADAVFSGVIFSTTANPVIFRQRAFGSTFLVTLQARVQLQDRRDGRILYRNDQYLFREQYVINVDVRNFFTELSPALERVARDFSSSVVATLMEGF